MKVCQACGLRKPSEAFQRRSRERDGLHRHCRKCKNERQQEWRQANPDKRREYDRQRYWRNPEKARAAVRDYYRRNKDARLAYHRQWRAENPETYRACIRASRELHREAIKERTAKWRSENTEHLREYEARYRTQNPAKRRQQVAKRRALKAATQVGEVDYEAILIEHGMTCHICTEAIADLADLQFDHVIPLSQSGGHVQENIRPAHAFCNNSKGARILQVG